MMQRVRMLIVISLVFAVNCYQKADASMLTDNKITTMQPARFVLNTSSQEQPIELNFNNSDDFYPIYTNNNITYVWAPTSKSSLINSFGTWHRGKEYLDEVVPEFKEGLMSLKYNTSAGGFFVNFKPLTDVSNTNLSKDTKAEIKGQISATLDLKRDIGSSGRILVEIKYENIDGQEKLKVVDITDEVKNDGKWNTVSISTDVDIMIDDLLEEYPSFTLAVVIEGTKADLEPAQGTLHIDNININPKLNLDL
ncbi:MAG: hypothetical protein NTZ48_02205 [Candidatus Omnitrophica bacterium]|nr:hypothetical protein [Candidatus Omnitrophota bacterium]